MEDSAKLTESASVGVLADVHDEIKWHCHTLLEKFDEDGNLYDTVEVDGNMLMTAGAAVLWSLLIGGSGTTFNNANARIGVGNGTTPTEAASQTDLGGGSKARAGMTSGYPNGSGASMIFQASFDGSTANFVWNEWGVFNAASAGVMLNRKVQSLGTKVAGTTWQLTVTLSLA